ncbi:MAG: hypothetical protein HQK81_00565 [Desulfovibrionaceae bacterium]|nr:hypothetical protein [Desulfovibrionaceae bacterium]MBF0512539.1 hypothetical protein [Desulfovibrionaceae bacterium]
MKKLEIQFVQFMPKELRSDTLYVSMEYATVVHLCACGCGSKVVTPLSSVGGWKLTYDGENLTLYPSIGNWSFPCRSHYFVRNSRVVWAGDMSQAEILAGREQDRKAMNTNYNRAPVTPEQPGKNEKIPPDMAGRSRSGILERLLERLKMWF